MIRPSVHGDAISLAPRLREADVVELAATGEEPVVALLYGLKYGECYSLVVDGKVEGMFGCAPWAEDPDEIDPDTDIGIPWLLGSEKVTQNPIRRALKRDARAYIEQFHAKYRLLTNSVWEDNTVSRRWLRWLGFADEIQITNYNHSGKTFRVVVSWRKDKVCAVQPSC